MTPSTRIEPSIWIAHDGKARPHPPQTSVEVLFRDNSRQRGVSAFVCWVHGSKPSLRDVVAYREIPPEMARTPWENFQVLRTCGAAVTLVVRPQDRVNGSIFSYLTFERLWDSFLTPKDKERAALKDEDLLEVEVKSGDVTVHRLGYDAEPLLAWAAIQVRVLQGRQEAA